MKLIAYTYSNGVNEMGEPNEGYFTLKEGIDVTKVENIIGVKCHKAGEIEVA